VPINTFELRKVLGCYATGVAIITARTCDRHHIAVTVNSFTSVSLDPPLILFSLVRSANVLAGFLQSSSFAVNILGQRQQALSNMFARPSAARWGQADFIDGSNGCALFAESLAHLECDKTAELDGGDHLIFLARVTDFHLHAEDDPLVFYRGAYGTYSRDPFNNTAPPDGSLLEFAVAGWS
jgi:flavin reductase (DIM6/NTAB) family NADH-FMN oxidoreductase RutF